MFPLQSYVTKEIELARNGNNRTRHILWVWKQKFRFQENLLPTWSRTRMVIGASSLVLTSGFSSLMIGDVGGWNELFVDKCLHCIRFGRLFLLRNASAKLFGCGCACVLIAGNTSCEIKSYKFQISYLPGIWILDRIWRVNCRVSSNCGCPFTSPHNIESPSLENFHKLRSQDIQNDSFNDWPRFLL